MSSRHDEGPEKSLSETFDEIYASCADLFDALAIEESLKRISTALPPVNPDLDL